MAVCRGGNGGIVLVADILHLDTIDRYTIVVVDDDIAAAVKRKKW